ncbi:hypothetical protein JI721_16050 [Alicyclobacillus cycloheptanicus]|jgi:hypothetical protein|uniref:Uncharacterized protein n=1 Tax=Alicyclobacillus cycloheptanicus TaxID=1457 RepID=A0ABT9XDT1_9BACL|nr:hypothetical protein [Alicyclobacillus cycloheptanicus]MDQ0188456.1 hypothetical protein [Alicyclobacillus cycloheptanicus]WDM01150.1 hypothetical protein JI721_16050 [Alicyclobacillus cycloheptanicus]
MTYHALITEQSRKAKAARNFYEYLRQKVNQAGWIPSLQWDVHQAFDGIRVPDRDRYKVLNIRLHDEHMSPYFKTDMNLFHMLMMDDTVDVTVFRAAPGWLFVFDGIPEGPKPFGQQGHDPR